ncbi:pilus assembly protein CpaB [Arthrobacter sp. CAN_A212]|uniref:Flp pilus assembly protein CpaB n=1 Tax=unclassified Arthrobacter TaxID=235627 RepID=UPI0018CAF5A6|nr:RcpC/CpaB family pilus assembly protein [Arthrobacter sp. CAN_C5]MBP2215729.1 pilus assembly protein CpaB [Arthrobacter sp. CAN_C5]
MKSRIIGAIAAVVLAVIGAVLLVQYVSASEQRALAGTETQTVLVVRNGISIPEGTTAEGIVELVSEEAVPAKVVPADAIVSLDQVAGLVTSVELVAGEQVLSSRFVDPAELSEDSVVEVPEGMQEVTILLEPQRAVGGQIRPGDTVGVFISLEGGGEENPLAVSHLTLHKVLVTNVQGLPEQVEESNVPGSTPIPAGSVLVTVARPAPDAEKVVYGQEFGRIWLSKEPATATEDGTRPITADEIYE